MFEQIWPVLKERLRREAELEMLEQEQVDQSDRAKLSQPPSRKITIKPPQVVVDQAKCRIIIAYGAKGTVQVAAFFGTSHLHTDLENARLSVVNLVSLHLEHSFDGDL